MSKATFDPTLYNKSNNEPFNQVLDKHLSRRNFVKSRLRPQRYDCFCQCWLNRLWFRQ